MNLLKIVKEKEIHVSFDDVFRNTKVITTVYGMCLVKCKSIHRKKQQVKSLVLSRRL